MSWLFSGSPAPAPEPACAPEPEATTPTSASLTEEDAPSSPQAEPPRRLSLEAAGAGGSPRAGAGTTVGSSVELAATIPDWSLQGRELPLSRGEDGGHWDEPDAAELFKLRSETYLSDKVKQLTRSQAFRLVGVNCFTSKAPITHAAADLPPLAEFMAAHADKTSQWFIVVFNLPGKPIHNVVYLFARQLPVGEDPAFDRLLERYLAGDDAFKNTRFKLLAKMEKAPWVLGAAVNKLGIERPAIIGKKLTIQHHVGARYFEADVDVGSSKIASAIHGLILRGCASIVVITAFTLEGQAEDELPERIMGNVRFRQIPISKFVIETDA